MPYLDGFPNCIICNVGFGWFIQAVDVFVSRHVLQAAAKTSKHVARIVKRFLRNLLQIRKKQFICKPK